MRPEIDFTIVSSCTGYGQYLAEWASSILGLTGRPARIALFTHGSESDRVLGAAAIARLAAAGLDAVHEHEPKRLDLGTARNRAVALSATEWVMHLDCDDTLMPHALTDIAALAPTADVIALGYERSGHLAAGPSNKRRLYSSTTGLQALDAAAPCSGVSPFRRSFWERSPYRTDMLGAWDTALWIGFARLGARFRPTKRPCFWYRQHADSIFNRRRKTYDWIHALTVAQLKSLRRDDKGVAVIIPRATNGPQDREPLWRFVRAHYEREHPDWAIVEGLAPVGRWCKGEAIADALSRSSAAILVIADADCLLVPRDLEQAVEAVRSGAASWVVPHTRVLRLGKARTALLLSGRASLELDERKDLARSPYTGYAGGGAVVVARSIYDASGGIPLAFRGWGAEDEALACILGCLVGPHLRMAGDLTHLWHAPQESKRLGTGNRPKLRALSAAAAGGKDDLLRALRSLAGGAVIVGARHPWRERVAAQANQFDRGARQSYLARRAAKPRPIGKSTPPKPPRRP